MKNNMEEKNLNTDQEKNVCAVVKCFLQNPKLSNKEIASITGISASSVQRALHNPKILDLFGRETQEKRFYNK